MPRGKKGGDIHQPSGDSAPALYRGVSRLGAESPLDTEYINQVVKGMRTFSQAHELVQSALHSVGVAEATIDIVARGKWAEEVSSDFIATIQAGTFTPEWLLTHFSNHDEEVFYSTDTDPELNPIPESKWARREALLQRVLPSGSEILFQLTPEQLRVVYAAQRQPRDNFFGDRSFLLDVWHRATRPARRFPTTVRHETTDFSLMIQTRLPGWIYCLELITDQGQQARSPSDEGKQTALLRERLVYGEIEQKGAGVRLEQEEQWGQWLASFTASDKTTQ